MAYEDILYEVEAGVATVTLNRPDRLNAWRGVMEAELRQAMRAASDDPEVKVIVLTGAGRGFCAGQDLADLSFEPGKQTDLRKLLEEEFNPLVRRLQALPKPVIARVQGIAAGAGANLALACDLVVAARSASFLQAFVNIGLLPDCGGTHFLPHRIGVARAMGLAMLGEKLPAEQAEAWGLIWKCVDDEALAAESTALATCLAAQPTRALARIKQAMSASFSNTLHEQLELEKGFMRELGYSHDYREGVAAFREKRKPEFLGE